MNLTPEHLKAIAKSQKYEVEDCGIRGLEIIECDHNGVDHIGWYNPLEDDSQLLELVEWLLKKDWTIGQYDTEDTYHIENLVEIDGNNLTATNKSFKHAVLEAVIKELGI